MYRSYLRLKGCPKCGGDILVDHAMEDEDICLQCGFRKPVAVAASQARPDRSKRKVAMAGRRADHRA